MDVRISENDLTITASFNGPFKEPDSELVRKTFDRLTAAPQQKVLLDLSMVPIMTSSGIGKLIILFKRLKGQNRELVIHAIHSNLYSMFVSINLHKMLTIIN